MIIENIPEYDFDKYDIELVYFKDTDTGKYEKGYLLNANDNYTKWLVEYINNLEPINS